ncbi:hypothetical protein ACFFHP_08365 [Glutamicibacter ardleyensis]
MADPAVDPKVAALTRLEQLHAVRTFLEEEPGVIARARLAGASWAQIGEATGYSRATMIKKAKEGNGGILPEMPRVQSSS